MNIKQAVAGVVIGVLGPAASAASVISSNFDSNTEGWTGINGVINFHWDPTGGQSGGFVRGRDAGEGTVWLLNAPSAYLGDLSGFYGGNLSFYLRQFAAPQPFVTPLPDVKIIGNGMSIVIDAGADPGNSWTLYSVNLTSGAWHHDTLDGALASAADIQDVLSNVTDFRIRAEYSSNVDSDGLDTVLLSSVPEPETYALMLAGLGVLGFVARRRR